MIEKRWILKEQGDERVVADLASALGIEPALANLLVQRGIATFDEAKAFFRPQIGHLHDPFLMKDMDKAVERLIKAVDAREKILVYGDYDVDGTTAVAVIYAFLKSVGVQVSYFIPDRYKDGYGVATRGIDHAVSCGATLIIALDCGIKAVEKVSYAKERGVDFIICDHHLPGSSIPDAVAVLDAQRPDCTYPYKDLSGCGVGYKLLQAYCIRRRVSCKVLEPLLDMVAVSIASDIVPITGENRIMAHYGLDRLNRSPRRGLHAIIKRSGLQENGHAIGIDDVVFRIGPRINAAGRMESGKTAVDLLTAETDEIANEVGDIINDHNNDRKDVDHRHTEEAKQIVEQDPQLQRKNTTVLYNPDWHKGVVGIVASRLVERFYRPSIVLTQNKENNLVTGSARSIPGFDLYRAIEMCDELLVSYGGHLYAAGLTLTAENVEPFIEKFEQVAAAMLTPEMLIPQVEIDKEISFASITQKFHRIIKQFQPFGPGNMPPVFCTRRVFCNNGNVRIVGVDKAHLKLDLVQEGTPNALTAIAFNFADFYDYIKEGNPIDICYAISENDYQGRTSLQLKVKDMKRSEMANAAEAVQVTN
ncbi:MAG: single-stranded-DNA-specific exonuclease RecJ [Prevotellaceae bacterium]|jgi:single-stranded-DNA-specific exonuclease|nr:single-stranded-DNA-specific exonuclease RecJ [Prevotellaceae bacterium]